VEMLLARDRDFSLFPELPTRDPIASLRVIRMIKGCGRRPKQSE
jgi:hypothetical protein